MNTVHLSGRIERHEPTAFWLRTYEGFRAYVYVPKEFQSAWASVLSGDEVEVVGMLDMGSDGTWRVDGTCTRVYPAQLTLIRPATRAKNFNKMADNANQHNAAGFINGISMRDQLSEANRKLFAAANELAAQKRELAKQKQEAQEAIMRIMSGGA